MPKYQHHYVVIATIEAKCRHISSQASRWEALAWQMVEARGMWCGERWRIPTDVGSECRANCYSIQPIGAELCLIAPVICPCIRADISFHFYKSQLLQVSRNLGHHQLLPPKYFPSQLSQFGSIIASVSQRDGLSSCSGRPRPEHKFRQRGII